MIKIKSCKKCGTPYTSFERFCRVCGFSEEKERGESIILNLQRWFVEDILEALVKENKLEKVWDEKEQVYRYKATKYGEEYAKELLKENFEQRLMLFSVMWDYRRDKYPESETDMKILMDIAKMFKKEFNANIFDDILKGVDKKIIRINVDMSLIKKFKNMLDKIDVQ